MLSGRTPVRPSGANGGQRHPTAIPLRFIALAWSLSSIGNLYTNRNNTSVRWVPGSSPLRGAILRFAKAHPNFGYAF